MGQLKDERHPEPTQESDHNFQQRQEFKSFNWLYVSNLDKLIAIALGAIATTVVWFGLLDRMYYPEPHLGDGVRIWFLGTVIAFYTILLVVCAVGIVLHRIFAAKSLDHHGVSYVTLLSANSAAAAIFFCLFGLTVFGVHLFGGAGAAILGFFHYAPIDWAPEYAAFFITRTILLMTILAPLYLLWRGERLSAVMTEEINRCVRELGERLAARAEYQSLDDEEIDIADIEDEDIPF